MKVFVINPGSTSTKLALYENGKALVSREFQHDKAELAGFDSVMGQHSFRMNAIRIVLAEEGVDTSEISAIAGRGGLLHPLEGGVYAVSEDMLSDLESARYGEHPCNLGAILADTLGKEWGVPAFIVDPVVTDEMMDVARFTGLPGVERRSLFHALNQRGAARTAAARLNVEYENSDFIVCHMGGGISIGAHRQGRVVDVINALDGEGPFSPERTGGLPIVPILDMIRTEQTTPEVFKEIVLRSGGLYAHLGTNDMREVVKRIEEGDGKAKLVFQAIAYSIAKSAASLVPSMTREDGSVDIGAVVLTGGLARCAELVEELSRLLGYLGPLEVVTGDEEMASLAAGPVRVLEGKELVKAYEISPK